MIRSSTVALHHGAVPSRLAYYAAMATHIGTAGFPAGAMHLRP
jgi:hypothetical protein